MRERGILAPSRDGREALLHILTLLTTQLNLFICHIHFRQSDARRQRFLEPLEQFCLYNAVLQISTTESVQLHIILEALFQFDGRRVIHHIFLQGIYGTLVQSFVQRIAIDPKMRCEGQTTQSLHDFSVRFDCTANGFQMLSDSRRCDLPGIREQRRSPLLHQQIGNDHRRKVDVVRTDIEQPGHFVQTVHEHSLTSLLLHTAT